ncbi:MAG: glycosyltransferase family 9 protein [Desulfovibrionaceae bacterium]|nr:glycosyltransferase family 9 protein [Desulfovibrionaceae bacterium]
MRRHLVIQLARFGDLLQTKRLIRSLQRDGEVHLCLDVSLAPLAALVYPDVILHPVRAHGAPSAEIPALAARNRAACEELAALDADAVYNLNHSGLNLALSTLFDPDCMRGHWLDGGQTHRDQWTDLAFRWVRVRRESPMNLMDFWGLLADEPVGGGEVNPIARPKGGGIGVVLAGRNARRSLPPDALAACIHAAATGMRRGAGFGEKILLLGTTAEHPQARALLGALPPALAAMTTDLTGRTGWADLLETLAPLDTVLTPDTGTMHLAAHLGAPVQGLFLSSAWAWETGPYGLGHRVWQAERDCAPCLESAPCPFDVACLEAFRTKEFLKFLSARFDPQFPPGMMGLATNLDRLGVVYVPVFGHDPFAARRNGLRALAAEYLGLGDAGARATEIAAALYQERDWMIEERRPARLLPALGRGARRAAPASDAAPKSGPDSGPTGPDSPPAPPDTDQPKDSA